MTVLDHDALLHRFELSVSVRPELADDERCCLLKSALDAADWPYHEDALGKLWAVEPTTPQP